MLDKNSLAQLSQLKKDIVSSKDVAEGHVVGANGRFGFVKLDDGRSAFLNPERMQKVLPGDRVRINVVKNDKDQLEAELEKLLETNRQSFIATYRVKGPNHFVQADAAAGGRWLFVPPPFRRRCQDGDYVLAELNKHPWDDGKASVKIITRIGAEGDDYLQHNLVVAQYGLNRYWSKDAQAQTDTVAHNISLADRKDFCDIPFVTIDSATTRDMDDAVFTQQSDNGWTLWVAIADPAHFIEPSSPLAKAARAFAQSVYLPGKTLPMLPETLSAEVFSLFPDQEKPALVAKIAINSDGSIGDFEFEYGKIKPREKLSYNDVAEFLDNSESNTLSNLDPAIQESLKQSGALAKKRLQYRQQNHLTYDEQPDFDYQLNKHGFIESIQRRERNDAHRLVEEAMIATNLCAGEILAKHKTGVFLVHSGFRDERLGEVKAVLREDLGENKANDEIQTLAGYIALQKHLQESPEHQHLLAPLKRMMQVAEISTTANPHFSMGFDHYATITSPIRRYVDLSNHWSLAQILANKQPQTVSERVLTQLQETLQKGRQASRQLELALHGHYLKNLPEPASGDAIIRIITQHGFGVRFVDNGIEGFIQFPKKLEKVYDAKRMTLQVNGRTFALEQIVPVRLVSVDLEKRRVKMELMEVDSEPSPQPEPGEPDNAATTE